MCCIAADILSFAAADGRFLRTKKPLCAGLWRESGFGWKVDYGRHH
jgi:hypothetical protein